MNANSTYQAPSNMTLDEWYNANNKQIEDNRKKQVEDAYVNQQLMNKYLQSNLSSAGLSRSGVASEYMNQSNINYRNQVASINKNAQDNQLALANQYYGYKKDEQDKADALAREEAAKQDAALKEKQDTLLGIYKQTVDNSLNEYDYLDDDTINSLYSQFNKNELGDTNSTYLDEYINMYRGSEEDIRNANYDRNYKDLASKFESEFDNDITQYDSYLNELNEALANGKINSQQYYALKSYLDDVVSVETEKNNEEREKYANAYYENYLGMADAEIGKYGVLTQEQYDSLLSKYSVEKIGQERYDLLEEYLKQYIADEKETEEVKTVQTQSDLKKMNSSVDVNSAIDVNNAGVKSFGSFNNLTGDQDKYVKYIIWAGKNNVFNDGDIIDVNYGIGENLYMYHKGKFYSVSKGSAKVTNDNIEDVFAEKGLLLPRV